MESSTQNEQRPTEDLNRPAGQEHDLKVEIRQYQTLLDILDEPRKVLKVIFAMVVLALAIFMALAFTAIAIKRFYPYNEIRTNIFGATTMQNEEVELTYWLFNTADLWANSGIRVERGDKLTIRASGKSNTSIHHLVDNAFRNSRPRYRWVGTEGEPRPANTRTAYRIYAERDPDALIMQVVPDNGYVNTRLREEYLRPDFVPAVKGEEDPQNRFYHIGRERTNLLINQSGTLHFAVNDIVLTDRCIDSMDRQNDRLFYKDNPDDYLDLLLLKHDTVMLERMLESEDSTLWSQRCTLLAEVRKKFGSRTDIEPNALQISFEYRPRDSRERLACLTETSRLWQVGDSIRVLRRKCDSLSAAHRYIREKRFKEGDPILEAIGSYQKKHAKYRTETERTGSAIDLELSTDTSLQRRLDSLCRAAYKNDIIRLTALVREVEPLSEKWREANEHGLYFGAHPVPLLSDIDNLIGGKEWLNMDYKAIRNSIYPFYNEMTYYRDTHYYDAWYEDNVGSFLIVVERFKSNDR